MKKAVPGGYREVLAVAWPLIISTGSFTIMQFVDRMFLAWYDPLCIQAALPAGILSFTLVCGFMALTGYSNTFVAQFHGAGDRLGCSRAAAQSCWLTLMCWPFLLLLIPAGEGLLRWSGHAPDVLALEQPYFRILMLGSVAIPLSAGISGFFTGRGDTLTNMVANIAGNVVNIVLDYAWIFGHWGFPRAGIEGAAYATVVAGFVTPAILFVLYFSRRIDRAYQTRKCFRLEPKLLARMVRFALPSGIHLFLDVASFAVFVLFTGRMGDLALAVSNIAFSINMVAFMPLVGISIAASTLVGQYQGRRDSATAEKAGWNSLRVGVGYMALVAVTYLLLPNQYFALFLRGEHAGFTLSEVMPLGRYLLVMMAAWGLLDAINLILSGALKGAGDTRFVMIYSSAMAWLLLVPVQAALVLWWQRGVLASWTWLTVFIMILSVGYFRRFLAGRWKSIEVLERGPELAPRGPGSEAMAVIE